MRSGGSAFLLASGADHNLRQTYGNEQIVRQMWGAADLVEYFIFFTLALMLVYTVFVTARFFRRYLPARRESSADLALASQRCKKDLIAELSRGVETLRSIAFAAPFLGLAGTCYGMLCLFFRAFLVSKSLAISAISLELSAALVATTAGLIVSIPAAVCYNVLRTRLEKFEGSCFNPFLSRTTRSYGFAQTLPLRRRFMGLPAFALIGAPTLAILIPMFLLSQNRVPLGLHVHLLKIGASDHDLPPIVVTVMKKSTNGLPTIYVNSKETTWNDLSHTLRSQLEVRPHWIVYVEGEDDAWWQDVANAIDAARGLHAEVVLLTTAARLDRTHLPEANTTERARHR
jgi:biopolymer transport protein ExbB/TolQ/biopolymer transport protein ExbD